MADHYLFADRHLTGHSFAHNDVTSGWWDGEEKMRMAILEGLGQPLPPRALFSRLSSSRSAAVTT